MMDLSEAMSPPEEVQEVSLSFARSPGDVASKKILLIYTGGTIGMAKREDGSLQVKRGYAIYTY